MIAISSINIDCSNNYYIVTWTVNPDTDDLSDYKFTLYKALAPEPTYLFEKVVDMQVGRSAPGAMGLVYNYALPMKVNSSIHEYFRIGVTELSTNTFELSSVVANTYMANLDNLAYAIVYQEEYFLDYILNRPAVRLLVKRRDGVRCTNCWDDEMQVVTKSNCTVCYNTGYVDGYLPIQEIKMSFTEPAFQPKFDINDIKDIQQPPTMGWTKNSPLILPGDIIVDEFNRRFKVIGSQPTTKDGRMYLRQNLQMQLIPPTDVIYRLNLDDYAITPIEESGYRFTLSQIDNRYVKWYKNMCYNSSFELYDISTRVPEYWTGGVSDDTTAFHDVCSMKLEDGEVSEQCEDGIFNPQEYDSIAHSTRVSFYKRGGAVRIDVLNANTGTAFTLIDENNNSGLRTDYIANTNWYPYSFTVSFVHGSATAVKVRFTNMDSVPCYIDAVTIEPDFNGKYPSLYTDGPYSTVARFA